MISSKKKRGFFLAFPIFSISILYLGFGFSTFFLSLAFSDIVDYHWHRLNLPFSNILKVSYENECNQVDFNFHSSENHPFVRLNIFVGIFDIFGNSPFNI